MTRIDFHTNVLDKLGYACRLTRKAYAAGNRVVVFTEDAAQLAALDALMWNFSATDFLPHVLAGDRLAGQTPIILTDSDSTELPHYDVLLNLARRAPVNVDRFQRLFEVVASDDADAAAGRKRYAAYKQQDYQPTHFVANQA